MTTADELMQRALALSGSDVDGDTATLDLLELASERRVAVVRARQRLLERLDDEPGEATATRAVELLDGVLGRLPV